MLVAHVEVWARVSMLGSSGTSIPDRATRINITTINSTNVKPLRLNELFIFMEAFLLGFVRIPGVPGTLRSTQPGKRLIWYIKVIPTRQ